MKRQITFSVTDLELQLIDYEAASRGLSRSQFCKMTVFSHINRYPAKGLIARMYQQTSTVPDFTGSQTDESEGGE